MLSASGNVRMSTATAMNRRAMQEKQIGGYVYILTNECFRQYDRKLVKVGMTSGAPGRIGNLNTSCPENFKVFKLVRTEDDSYKEIEAEALDRLWDVRHYTKQCESTEFLHCTPKRALDVIKRIVKERGYQVSYSTIALGRSRNAIKSNTDRSGWKYRNGNFFLGVTEYGAAMLEKKGGKLYVVKKRSHIANVGGVKKIHSKTVAQMRKDYKAKISSRGILGCDVPCESMSEAAIFVRGTQTNGKKFWQKM